MRADDGAEVPGVMKAAAAMVFDGGTADGGPAVAAPDRRKSYSEWSGSIEQCLIEGKSSRAC